MPSRHVNTCLKSLLSSSGEESALHKKHWLAGVVSTPVIAARARAQLLAKTRGHYPALTRALEVIVEGFRSTEAESLALERTAVIDLAAGPVAPHLMRLFFQQERARKLEVPGAPKAKKIEHAAVIGAGLMGSAIAQWLSARGVRVILRDVDAARVAAGMANISRLFAAGLKRHAFTARDVREALARVSPAPAEVPLHRADLVLEAAVEKMEIKKAIFPPPG